MSRQRVTLARAGTIALTTAVILTFFLLWYRHWPHQRDCFRSISRLSEAMVQYKDKHGRFPPGLAAFDQNLGRYTVEHYDYRLRRFATDPPDGTVLVHCLQPHTTAFHEPWRHMAVWTEGRVIIKWILEKDFQELQFDKDLLEWPK